MQSQRQTRARDLQSSRQDYRDTSREDWQNYGDTARSGRQDYYDDVRKGRQEYVEHSEWAEDYHSPYYRNDYWEEYPAGAGLAGLAAGMAIGSAIAASQFRASCAMTPTIVSGATYYQCGGNWYQPAYQGGEITYVVVTPPQGSTVTVK